ncbi:MAG: hypothetical protein ACPG4J_11265 [Lentibacter algarum]
MSDTLADIAIARLVGVTEHAGVQSQCSLVFHLETEEGARLELTHANIMQALRFAQESGAMPALPEDWWARDGGTNGC